MGEPERPETSDSTPHSPPGPCSSHMNGQRTFFLLNRENQERTPLRTGFATARPELRYQAGCLARIIAFNPRDDQEERVSSAA